MIGSATPETPVNRCRSGFRVVSEHITTNFRNSAVLRVCREGPACGSPGSASPGTQRSLPLRQRPQVQALLRRLAGGNRDPEFANTGRFPASHGARSRSAEQQSRPADRGEPPARDRRTVPSQAICAACCGDPGREPPERRAQRHARSARCGPASSRARNWLVDAGRLSAAVSGLHARNPTRPGRRRLTSRARPGAAATWPPRRGGGKPALGNRIERRCRDIL